MVISILKRYYIRSLENIVGKLFTGKLEAVDNQILFVFLIFDNKLPGKPELVAILSLKHLHLMIWKNIAVNASKNRLQAVDSLIFLWFLYSSRKFISSEFTPPILHVLSEAKVFFSF